MTNLNPERLNPTEEEIKEARKIIAESKRKKRNLSTEFSLRELPPETDLYYLQAENNGLIYVYPSTGFSRESIAVFDVSQMNPGNTKDEAMDLVDPELRWAEYCGPTDVTRSPFIDLDISDDVNTPNEYNFTTNNTTVFYYPPRTEESAEKAEELMAETGPLSAGDIVDFGRPIGKKEIEWVNDTSDRSREIWFYPVSEIIEPSEGTSTRKTDPAEQIVFNSYGPIARHIMNSSFKEGSDNEKPVSTGVITGISLTEYTGKKYDADLVAEVDWEITPRPT